MERRERYVRHSSHSVALALEDLGSFLKLCQSFCMLRLVLVLDVTFMHVGGSRLVVG